MRQFFKVLPGAMLLAIFFSLLPALLLASFLLKPNSTSDNCKKFYSVSIVGRDLTYT